MTTPPPAPFRHFLGDAERDFLLTVELVTELERLTGAGIGGFSRRFMQGDFHLAHLHHVIRLGLIGGGTDPQEAAALIAAYVAPRPVLEGFALAVGVLDHLMTGGSPEQETVQEAAA